MLTKESPDCVGKYFKLLSTDCHVEALTKLIDKMAHLS